MSIETTNMNVTRVQAPQPAQVSMKGEQPAPQQKEGGSGKLVGTLVALGAAGAAAYFIIKGKGKKAAEAAEKGTKAAKNVSKSTKVVQEYMQNGETVKLTIGKGGIAKQGETAFSGTVNRTGDNFKNQIIDFENGLKKKVATTFEKDGKIQKYVKEGKKVSVFNEKGDLLKTIEGGKITKHTKNGDVLIQQATKEGNVVTVEKRIGNKMKTTTVVTDAEKAGKKTRNIAKYDEKGIEASNVTTQYNKKTKAWEELTEEAKKAKAPQGPAAKAEAAVAEKAAKADKLVEKEVAANIKEL